MIFQHLVTMGIPVAEKVIRTVGVYAGMALLLRVFGKRELAQLNTFDLVVMLLLSNVLQNAVIGSDNSLVGGLLGALVLIALNSGVVRLVGRSDTSIAMFEGRATTLIRNGQVDDRAIHRLGLRRSGLEQALHRQGADSLDQVAEATLEPGGAIVVRQHDADRAATRQDLADLEMRLLAALRAGPGD
ncbi:MAG: YetF domain-containing protein [Pseudonocardiales bacterium]